MSTSSSFNEKELLMQIAQGDESAFREIFQQYGDLVHRNIYSITKSNAATDDLVQDSFMRVWLYRDKLPEIENFRAWLLRISYNRAFSYLRDRITQEKGGQRYKEKYAADISNNQTMEHIQFLALQKVIHEVVQSLPPQQRKIYLLSRQQGMKLGTIAEELGLSPSTVKNTLGRALQALRDAVEKAGLGILLIGFYWVI